MYSSEDLERFYFDYQTEWMPRGMSIQAYCSRNNVPYKVLDRWIRDIYKRVVPVQITGAPEELKIDNSNHAETEPKKKTGNEFRSPYMMQALNYLDHFWDGLFLYRKDGSYPIDNNLAERSVRPFTTKRKCSLHLGSDEGVEMSAVYHSIISTLKLCGKSVWSLFGEYFRCEVLGMDTYKEYLPALSR